MPAGSYSIEDLNNFLNLTMIADKHVNTDDSFVINIYASYIYKRVTIQVSADYILGIQADMRVTLGFDSSQNALTK